MKIIEDVVIAFLFASVFSGVVVSLMIIGGILIELINKLLHQVSPMTGFYLIVGGTIFIVSFILVLMIFRGEGE